MYLSILPYYSGGSTFKKPGVVSFYLEFVRKHVLINHSMFNLFNVFTYDKQQLYWSRMFNLFLVHS
jgi:hypothetical protein